MGNLVEKTQYLLWNRNRHVYTRHIFISSAVDMFDVRIHVPKKGATRARASLALSRNKCIVFASVLKYL